MLKGGGACNVYISMGHMSVHLACACMCVHVCVHVYVHVCVCRQLYVGKLPNDFRGPQTGNFQMTLEGHYITPKAYHRPILEEWSG